jgi:hypothetical protein
MCKLQIFVTFGRIVTGSQMLRHLLPVSGDEGHGAAFVEESADVAAGRRLQVEGRRQDVLEGPCSLNIEFDNCERLEPIESLVI